MKYSLLFPLLISLIVALAYPFSQAMSRPPNTDINLYGHLNQSCIGHNGGSVYLQLEIVTGKSHEQHYRPMNISVVLDRSGSMGDERKMEKARSAEVKVVNDRPL